MAYSPGAFVALLCSRGRGGGALVLQRVEAVPVQWHLFFKLVQEVCWDSVHFATAAVRGRAAVVSRFPATRGVPATVPRSAAVVHAGESATGDRVVSGRHGHRHHHALGVDGAPWGAAVMTVKVAALSGAEEIGRRP